MSAKPCRETGSDDVPMEWIRGFVAARFEFDGLIAVLQGFFDESATHRGSAVTCLAGVLFDSDGLTEFTKEWHPHVSGLSKPFRTTHAVHGYGAFEDWPRWRRDALLDRLACLITDTRRLGFIASMTQTDHDSYKSGCAASAVIPSIYVLCLSTCLEMVGNLLAGQDEILHYTFEKGDEHEEEAQYFLRKLNQHVPLVERFHIGGYAFEDKRTVIALHAADFLAWEWQANFKALVSGKEHKWTDRMKMLQRDKGRIFMRHIRPIGIGMQDMFNTIYLAS